MKVVKALFLLLCFFSLENVYSQSSTADPANIPKISPPSPNAASLGIYGQIPVSLFSGLPQVSIPIGGISVNEANIDISLNYHGGGIKPEQHSGWVGLGWDLNAGGVISRKVNGESDEMLITGQAPENKFAYYDFCSRGDTSNWNTILSLSNYYYREKNDTIYPSPDEFTFNFGKYSGSFFYNHKGKWQVKSNDPLSLKVQEEIKYDYKLAPQKSKAAPIIVYDTLVLRRVFYKFTLTTPDGCKFIFGGTPESIEFTRSSVYDINDSYNAMIIPISWYLTKIITSKGQEINFSYERDGINAVVSTSLMRYQFNAVGHAGEDRVGLSVKSCNIINTAYLKTITAPNQKIVFYRSKSIELPYKKYDDVLANTNLYPDLCYQGKKPSQVTDNIRWMKLDSISFYSDSSTLLKKMTFYFKEQLTARLKLDSVKEMGAGGIAKPSYQFTYDTTTLPDYNAQRLDHWGYYNARNYFTETNRSPSSYTDADIPAYYATRNSNLTFMKAGILTSIKYPTGGLTTLQYESNDYAKIANRFPFVVTDTNLNALCGGLRIQKIINSDALGNTQTVKEYYYKLNYNTGGNVSSGILAGYPQYLDQGQGNAGADINYWFWHDFPVEPLSYTDGNHVTYSEVVEKLKDGSYTIYKYANHDMPQYRDTLPLSGIYFSGEQWKLDPTTTRSLERGKLLNKRDFNATGILLKKTNYEYDTSSARYNEAIRMVNIVDTKFGSGTGRRLTAYLIYTYPRFLTKEIDSIWDQNGANPMATIQSHQYNNFRLRSLDSSGNSTGDTLKVSYKYPFDMLPGSDPTGIYQKMVDSNQIEPIIEKRNFQNGTQISLVRTNYYSPFTKIYVPQTVDVQNKNYPIETRLRYQGYDARGNILSVSKEGDIPLSYIWNYARMLPIAEVKNASPIEIAYTSFESDSTGNWNNYSGIITTAAVSTPPPTGSSYYNLTTTAILTKTGLSSAKTYVVSYWTTNSVAFSITGTVSGYPRQGKIVNGWTYFEHQVTGQTSISISGTGTLDEVRLYPVAAQMTTYAYLPQVGVSSVCDINNKITYYEYDGLTRLTLIRDQDKNVIKKIGYKYYNQPADGEFSNVQQTVRARRNSCPVGQAGDSVTYIVSENKYVSTKGQAYVDSLALADANANKQSYANANGNCTPIPVTVSISGYNGGIVLINFTNAAGSYRIQAGGGTAMMDIPYGTYTITCEVKSGAKITFSLNGILQTDSFATYSNIDIHDSSTILMGVYANTTQSITKQRNNCQVNEIPSSVTYNVPANIYVSTISQSDANTQAINMSQAAAQTYANSNGTCTAIPTTTSIVYTNFLNKKVTLTLTNVSTSVVYTFTLNITSSSTTAGSVPTGNYNVVMHANGPSNYYTINSYVENADDTDLNMTNIPLNTATTTVSAH